jgi:ubiquinone/menaquinone biosynthesis C-methylase UbiE
MTKLRAHASILEMSSFNRVEAGYDAVAGEYVRRIYKELEAKPFDREWLEHFALSTPEDGNLCDLGCGPGHVASYVKQFRRKVTGIDISSAMIAQARRLDPEIRFIRGDMRALPVKDECFDGIAAFYSTASFGAGCFIR